MTLRMNPLILIPARMNATRLPNKPLADIHGVPMIVHVWRRAVESGVGEVWVACDDARILDAVEKSGGRAVLTKPEHPSGSDRIWEAVQKIDPNAAHDTIINLQGDMPTIDPKIVRDVLEPLAAGYDMATLVTPITNEAEENDPAVVKAVVSFQGLGFGILHSGQKNYQDLNQRPSLNAECRILTPGLGRALYFTRANAPTGDGPRYHHIGIYAYTRPALKQFVTLPPSPLEKQERLEQLRALEHGITIGVKCIDTVPLGVDTLEHLEKARSLLSLRPRRFMTGSGLLPSQQLWRIK